MENWSALKLYRFYRKEGLRPVNAYFAVLFWKTSLEEHARRIQRVADWLNGRYVTRSVCQNTYQVAKR